MAMHNGSYQHQGDVELQLFVGSAQPADTDRVVPWEHRGLLGQTRGAGGHI